MRYIGNKTKLLFEIQNLLIKKRILNSNLTFCDIFSGTGCVGDFVKSKYRIIANDSLYAAYCVTAAKLRTPSKFHKLSVNPFQYFNSVDTSSYTIGFCYNNFAPTVSGRMYFSDENAKKIDFIRDSLDKWFEDGILAENEYVYLIGCLIESVSKVANVAGVYSAFLRKWDPRALKPMMYVEVERISGDMHSDNVVYNKNANDLIKEIKGDILYIDPPYTSTQYISQYHVLETIARNDRPITHGVGAHRDNGNQISYWCKKEYVAREFEELIANANFKYIIFSYSDAGLMPKELIEKILKRYAVEGTYSCQEISFVKYKNTRALNREIKENTASQEHFEWLFYIEKKEDVNYASPLNYIGGKQDVISLIKGHMPDNINTFYDLFGGGATVSINVPAKSVVYNDINWNVSRLLQFIGRCDIGYIEKYITKTIDKFSLSKANKEAYTTFRNNYNATPIEKRKPLDLYLLICYGFEHQIRYNSKMEFNNPCGNSGYNPEMRSKLISFHNRVNRIDMSFYSENYDYFEDRIKADDFVYCDPPYLNSCGAYNDGKRGFNGWDEKQEKQLLEFLLRLHKRGIKFMLSNMSNRNGSSNQVLMEWVEANGFKVICNPYLTKRNRQDRQEILIINY